MGQRADGFNSVLDAGFDDAVPGVELVAAAVHMIAEQSRVHTGRDLGRTGGLGPVADDAGRDRHGVDERVLDMLISAAIKICNARSRAAACRDGSAVGGQRPDMRLDMNRAQIGHSQRPVERFAAHAKLLCVDDDRHGGSDALIAGTGIDDDRQLAAGHPCVAGRSGHIAGTVVYRLAIGLTQRSADVRAIGAAESCLRDGHVI